MPVTAQLTTQSLLCLGEDPRFAMLVAEGAAAAFPDVKVQAVSSLATALREDPDGRELLVLGDPPAEVLAQALGVADEAGLPRWAVVVLGDAPESAGLPRGSIVRRDEWSAAVVARVFLAAGERHRWVRENAQLRGDLATFGFRIAHDLRTPLGGVMTTTEMLREVMSEEAPQLARLVSPILDSGEGLVKLIEQMSFIAKLAASREPAERLNMNLPFWNAFQHVESTLLKAGRSLAYPREWPEVLGHASWLEVVWQHLICNAIQHGGGSGRIEAGWTAEAEGFRFFVQDGGQVAPERRSLLFFPLERLHEPGAPRGLGLPVVRRIVEREGGRCGFEAPAEGGSVFYFVLPAVGN